VSAHVRGDAGVDGELGGEAGELFYEVYEPGFPAVGGVEEWGVYPAEFGSFLIVGQGFC